MRHEEEMDVRCDIHAGGAVPGRAAWRGPKGEKGDPFTFADLTEEQKAARKEEMDVRCDIHAPVAVPGWAAWRGPKGEQGDPFTFADLTEEQRAAMDVRCDIHAGGAVPGRAAWRGPKGEKGDHFTFADLTEEQRAALKGEKGDPLTFNDLTEEQREALKGEKGDPLTFNDLTEEQRAALRGEKGEPGTGLTVLDHYDTEAALSAAVTEPQPGDAYSVGAAEPYDICIYSKTSGWVNHGPLQGVPGAVFTPAVSEEGVLSWSNDGGLANPEPVSIRGPKGDKGDALTFNDLRKSTRLNFSGWDAGSFTETIDGDETEYTYGVEFDAQGRPTKITDNDGHETAISW